MSRRSTNEVLIESTDGFAYANQPTNQCADESRKQQIAFGPSDESADTPGDENRQCTDWSTDNAAFMSINECTTLRR
jgi:hypothetical protein